MIWHPPLGATAMTLLVLAALAAVALSYLWSRRQLDPTSPEGLITIGLRTAGLLLLLLLVLQPARLPRPETITVHRTLAVLIDNSASMALADRPGDDATRLGRVRRALTDHRFQERIGEQANLAYYGFDGRLNALDADALPDLAGDGRATDIAAALQAAARQHQHDDLAGILLISDGRVTQGDDPLALSETLDAPIHTLTVGEVPDERDEAPDQPQRDLAIESVSAEPRIILGRSANVAVSISATGYQSPRQVQVELVREDEPLGSSAVAVSPQQPRRQALFTVQPDAVGSYEYQVRIPTENDERDPTNNIASFTVEVVDPINRLLYIDRLRQERRFLNNVIRGQRNLRYTSVVQQDEQRVLVQGNDSDMKQDAANFSPEQLRGLKAVVLGDVPADTLDPAQVEALAHWVDTGGALLLLGGPSSLGDEGFAQTPLAQLLPVQMGPGKDYLEEEYRVQLTPDGAAHPAFQRVAAQRWTETPPLLTRVRVANLKPAATVLFAVADDPNTPVVVSHGYGHGKVAVVLTDSTWRWQLGFNPTAGQQASEHALFWQQMIDWLMPELEDDGETGGQVQLITDRLEYEVNDEVVMLAAVRAADGTFMRDAEVNFTIATPDGRPMQRAGTLDETGEGQGAAFNASFEAISEGEYAIQATATRNGRTIGVDQAQVRVQQPQVELVRTDPDRQLLRELAARTDGRALQPTDLEHLLALADLEPREVEVQPSSEADAEPVWNRWWLLVAFLVIMAGEWFVRRRNQWV
ncbi:MAG: glutamine amidotransferase [Phycisphaeraceae bacterium]